MHDILIAEDSSVLRIVLRRTFSLAGYSVKTAVDGLDAWQQAEEEDFRLIVTDQQMPGLNGTDLCQRLRQCDRFAETPIMMVTAKAYELNVEHLKAELGIDAVFVKPFSPTKLLSVVRDFLPAPIEASST